MLYLDSLSVKEMPEIRHGGLYQTEPRAAGGPGTEGHRVEVLLTEC